MKEGGHIKLSADLTVTSRLTISVEDNGVHSGIHKEGTGTGLQNVRRRLEQFFDGDFTLDYGRVSDEGFCVRIEVPFFEYKEDEN